ncbi:MAG: peptidoglycan DD-metalloendopeptidase family protein [Anaerolineales bacterium]
MKIKKTILIFILIILAIPYVNALGQTTTPAEAVYIVQSGDSLWDIAARFRVSLEELEAVNNLQNPNALVLGAELKIPGISGFSGRLTTVKVQYGENLDSLSRRYNISKELLSRLNHLVNPRELVVGSYLVIPEENAQTPIDKRVQIIPGQSMLDIAMSNQLNPWQISTRNGLKNTYEIPPNGFLYLPVEDQTNVLSALPSSVKSVDIQPSPLLQGKTIEIKVKIDAGISLSGNFMGHPLTFFDNGDGELVTLLGVHAMAQPGIYPLEISLKTQDGKRFDYSQEVIVGKVDYPYDNPLTVDPETIDPKVTDPENQLWASYAQAITPQKYWDGAFQMPTPLSKDYCLTTNDCWSSRFGNRRSYNGGTYDYFHSGLDIVGKEGTEIYAPAAGVVVFTGQLTVRGNTTMIDHGWGVYSGYYHQKEILVKVGDKVEAGQLIGYIGATGRVEGPHLHWEIWVNGVQVDPLDWLKNTYP